MKKYKVAIVLSVFDLNQVSHRGVASYLSVFLPSLANACELDVYCLSTSHSEYPGFNKISVVSKEETENPDFLWNCGYDFVVGDYNSRYFYNLELRHSHSPMYREDVVRTQFEMFIKRIFDRKRLVNDIQKMDYQKKFEHLAVLLANSEIAREDYIKYGAANPLKTFVLTPCVRVGRDFDFKMNQTFTFGMSAVTFALKGGYTFLSALHKLKLSGADFRAKIIYPGYDTNMLLKLYVVLLGLQKHIEFLPFQSDMEAFYHSIDCLVVPSREETFGMVVLEAMSNSRPVVLSSRCGAVDIISQGENGFIFDYDKGCIQNLFQILKSILDNKTSVPDIAFKAYETAKSNGIERHSQDLAQILDDAYNIMQAK